MGLYSGTLLLFLFTLILFIRLLRPLYSKETATPGPPRLSEVLVVSIAVSCLFYVLFYANSARIWAANPPISPSDLTIEIRGFSGERDGIESFVLYTLVMACMLATALLTTLAMRIYRHKVLQSVIFFVLLAVGGWYFYTLGFAPPMVAADHVSLYIPITITFLSLVLYLLHKKSPVLGSIALVFIMAFAGLISRIAPSVHDLSYVAAPALRMLHGIPISRCNFQYDLLLSFIALGFLKLHIPLAWFACLGQCSFFLLFLAIFFYSGKLFRSPGLAVLCVCAVMLCRFYSRDPGEPSYFQVTPLRLDLWVIPLLIAYRKGIYHWATGLSLFLLILLHRNLGLLYTAAYIQLVIVLFIVTLLDNRNAAQPNPFKVILRQQLRLNAPNVALIAGSVALCFIFFGGLFSPTAIAYRQIGIGMLTLSRISLYWYMPVIFSTLFVLLIYYRDRLGNRYVQQGLFIIFLAIANSMYFFGRSHNSNLLHICTLLVLTLFVLFDVLIFLFPARPLSLSPAGILRLPALNSYPLLPFLFILIAAHYYGNQAKTIAQIQLTNLTHGQVAYSLPVVLDIGSVKKATQNSPDVYFLDIDHDFYYYYYGGYTPQGYYSPCASFLYNKDLIAFMQDLLDHNYYIVCENDKLPQLQEYISKLSYTRSVLINNTLALKK